MAGDARAKREPFHMSRQDHREPADTAPHGPSGRFSWPPRPIVVPQQLPGNLVDPGDLAPPGCAVVSEADVAYERGVRPLVAPRAGSWWAQVEGIWLDVAAPPLVERAAAAGWAPDGPNDYCHRCGRNLEGGVSGDRDTAGCPRCADERPPWSHYVRLGSYEPPLSRWVQDMKFTRWRRLGLDLGRWLGEAIARDLEAARSSGGSLLPEGPPVVVPVPMSLRRRLVRGIDHTHVIAKGVAGVLGGNVVCALSRKHRPSQVHVVPSRRAANVSGVFRARPRLVPRLEGRLVILIDDVSTTGATLRAACSALRAGRPKGGKPSGQEQDKKAMTMWVGIVARTPEDRDDRLIA